MLTPKDTPKGPTVGEALLVLLAVLMFGFLVSQLMGCSSAPSPGARGDGSIGGVDGVADSAFPGEAGDGAPYAAEGPNDAGPDVGAPDRSVVEVLADACRVSAIVPDARPCTAPGCVAACPSPAGGADASPAAASDAELEAWSALPDARPCFAPDPPRFETYAPCAGAPAAALCTYHLPDEGSILRVWGGDCEVAPGVRCVETCPAQVDAGADPGLSSGG